LAEGRRKDKCFFFCKKKEYFVGDEKCAKNKKAKKGIKKAKGEEDFKRNRCTDVDSTKEK